MVTTDTINVKIMVDVITIMGKISNFAPLKNFVDKKGFLFHGKFLGYKYNSINNNNRSDN